MHAHWWQSIRWRLALGSMLVTLLATALLSVIMVIAINISYGGDQSQQVISLANGTAPRIGTNYEQTHNLLQAAQETVPDLAEQNSEDYFQLVYAPARPARLAYPRFNGKTIAAGLLVAAADPSVGNGDYLKISQAINKARSGVSTPGEIDVHVPGASPRPFMVVPIFAANQPSGTVIGILLVIPRSVINNTIPPFLATVRQAILMFGLIVAALAGLAAILFSRTITRPLAKLTQASRILAGGDYRARARVKVQGEIGELASSFNEMATRLEQDVDELRRQEQQRRELIMNITHDLATPLTAIAGLGEALIDGVNQDREDFEETGRVIVRETLRLRRLVKDLHLMSRAEAGAMQPRRRAVRLAPLVDEVFAALIPEFERINVEPRNNLPYDLSAVWADPDMLTRVFDNLCSNALRYTPSGGSITISAVQEGAMLHISVTDSGQGIATGALDRVFDRFYRVDVARQSSTGGSGLGLAIVRAIIMAHGGTVFAENAPGAGARITFTLPRASANWEQLSSESTLPLPPRGATLGPPSIFQTLQALTPALPASPKVPHPAPASRLEHEQARLLDSRPPEA